MKIAMADARGPNLDQHLAGAGRRQIERFHRQGLALLSDDRCLYLHGGILLLQRRHEGHEGHEGLVFEKSSFVSIVSIVSVVSVVFVAWVSW